MSLLSYTLSASKVHAFSSDFGAILEYLFKGMRNNERGYLCYEKDETITSVLRIASTNHQYTLSHCPSAKTELTASLASAYLMQVHKQLHFDEFLP